LAKGNGPVLQLQSTESAPHGLKELQNPSSIAIAEKTSNTAIELNPETCKGNKTAPPKIQRTRIHGDTGTHPPMRQRPDADCRAIIRRQDLERGQLEEASSSNKLGFSKLEAREGIWSRSSGRVYLLVKSRPRQKLPTQSRTAHLLDTPPPSPPPPRLQLMPAATAAAAAAATRYELSLPQAARPPVPASAPRLPDRIHGRGTELDVEERKERLARWAFSVCPVAAAAVHLLLAFHVGEGSVDATRSRATDGRSVMPVPVHRHTPLAPAPPQLNLTTAPTPQFTANQQQ